MTPHPLCLAYPDMRAEDYRRLLTDIKANGLNNPIVLLDGQILDGRHRFRACGEAGVAKRYREFRRDDPTEASKGDPVAFVNSENAARRQMSESQLAYAITHPNIVEYERERAAERQIALAGTRKPHDLGADRHQGEAGRVAAKLAEKAGVGARTINRALKVREHGIPEVNAAVAAGEVTLNMAEKIVELRPSAQKRVIEAPPKRRQDELQSAINRSEGASRREVRNAAPPRVEPSTAFVRKVITGLERVIVICAEEGAKDGPAIAKKFLNEMDWASQPLAMQFERVEPLVRALALIHQHQASKAA